MQDKIFEITSISQKTKCDVEKLINFKARLQVNFKFPIRLRLRLKLSSLLAQ